MTNTTRIVTVAEAKQIALRLIAGAFRRDGERLPSGQRPVFSIPTRVNDDDDCLIIAFIEQRASQPSFDFIPIFERWADAMLIGQPDREIFRRDIFQAMSAYWLLDQALQRGALDFAAGVALDDPLNIPPQFDSAPLSQAWREGWQIAQARALAAAQAMRASKAWPAVFGAGTAELLATVCFASTEVRRDG
jgi:hypothetical protein